MYKRIITTDWDFRTADTKEYTHCYHTYPAMMIPQIARKLIEDYAPQNLNLIFDPYVGSGTTLVEAAIKGINSIGIDINPLARFISFVKTRRYDVDVICGITNDFIDKLKTVDIDQYRYNDGDFDHITNSDYWYSKENLTKLKFLTDVINDIDSEYKSFYELALSEIIREVSYTRNSEFKRYRIEEKKIPLFNVDPFRLFIEKLRRNVEGLVEFSAITKDFNVIIEDKNTVDNIPVELIRENSVDMVITSPPYGDSRTTVAYGQFSRWASEWFKFPNASNIDKHLMGGKINRNIDLQTNSISKELNDIKIADIDRYHEVVSFLDDYKKSIQNVAKTLRKGGRICYIVGNRTVKEVQIPLDFFTVEMFEKNGFMHDTTFVRAIPNKRMPSKTSPSNKKGENVSTMTSEYIVIMTKK